MYDGEDNLQMPALAAPELDVPMPDHLQATGADTFEDPQATANPEQLMEQGPTVQGPEDFGSLAAVIQGTQDTHGQVATDMGWSKAA